MYDQYLKANRVEAGVRSYGLVVTLILRARFDESWNLSGVRAGSERGQTPVKLTLKSLSPSIPGSDPVLTPL